MGQGWPQHQVPGRPIGSPEAVHRSLSAGTLASLMSIPKAGRPALARRFKASMPDYRNKRLGRETGYGRPFVITPAGARSEFIDYLQQLESRPESLIA